MRKSGILLGLLAVVAPISVQAGSMDQSMPAMPGDQDTKKMDGMEMAWPATTEQIGDAPPPAPPTDHAAELFYDPAAMAAARQRLDDEHGGAPYSKVIVNLAEFQSQRGQGGYRWDGEAWYGGDIDRFVAKSEGQGGIGSGLNSGEVQALYSRAISPFFDVQGGVRQDVIPTPLRTYGTMGLEGLAPYWFETNTALFLSDRGELLGRVEGLYDLNLTQRLILQPRTEINLSAQDIRQTGVGAGISTVEVGLRLRYEIRREFAPYIGVSYDGDIGQTAAFARQRGDAPHQTSVVVGIHSFF